MESLISSPQSAKKHNTNSIKNDEYRELDDIQVESTKISQISDETQDN